MREILFRAKRLDNGEWAESGSLTKNEYDDGRKEWFIGARQPADLWTDDHGNMVAVETRGDCLFYACDPDTIGQFTGLTDKNGTKIFEGDIVESEFTKKPYLVCFGEYTYTDEQSACGWYNEEKGGYVTAFGCPDAWATVIGNIHDNPELMTKNSAIDEPAKKP